MYGRFFNNRQQVKSQRIPLLSLDKLAEAITQVQDKPCKPEHQAVNNTMLDMMLTSIGENGGLFVPQTDDDYNSEDDELFNIRLK